MAEENDSRFGMGKEVESFGGRKLVLSFVIKARESKKLENALHWRFCFGAQMHYQYLESEDIQFIYSEAVSSRANNTPW